MPRGEWTVLRYANTSELPSADEMIRLTETNDQIIFEVSIRAIIDANGERTDEAQDERKQLVQELAARLPDHDVWEIGLMPDEASIPAAQANVKGSILTGSSELRIRRALSQQVKEENLPRFLAAALSYEETVNPLMRRLAQQLGVAVSDFTDIKKCRASWWDEEQEGRLEIQESDPAGTELWEWFFHGHDCRFYNAKGVRLEALLGGGTEYGPNFGVFGSFSFWKFIKTSELFAPLTDLLGEHGDNTGHFLQYAERLGFLQSLSRGYLLTDLGRQRANEARAEGKTTNA